MDIISDQPVTRVEALELLRNYWEPSRLTEMVPLSQARGRVTASDQISVNTLPPYRTSQVDGIAVQSFDFANGIPDTTGWKAGIEYVHADTGDDFPDEYDTIIPVESIRFNAEGNLSFAEGFTFSAGERINKYGCLVKEGEVLVSTHSRLTPLHLSVLAMGGVYLVEVYKKPRIVYIPTGSELITVGMKPERGQNIESNSLMVNAFLEERSAEPVVFPIVKDDPEALENALNKALAIADIVLINGGSSKGVDDLNAALLQKKATFYRHGIRAIPGKPVAIAIIDQKPVINMPGPAMATFLALDWCVSGLINHYYETVTPCRQKIKVTLEQPLQKREDFEQYFRFVLVPSNGNLIARPVNRFASTVKMLLEPDAVFIAPIGRSEFKAGEEVEVELFHGLETFQADHNRN